MKRIWIILLGILLVVPGVVAGGEIVGTLAATFCCEKTDSGNFCQDVPKENCLDDVRQPPTACESTSFCKPGYCFDSDQGTCLDNVPQMVCNDNGGTWTEEKPEACNLGCCILGDQASFVTLIRCKRLSGYYGLESNWNSGIENEVQCILTARAEEKGACVFEHEFEKTCKLVTRSECVEGVTPVGDETTNEVTEEDSGFFEGLLGEETGETNEEETEEPLQSPAGCEETSDGVTFCPGMLCSAEELGTNCGPSEETACLDGKEEVYFLDTCGNPANIYDANKIRNDNYWTYIQGKGESCGADASNEDSQTCGNCNYLLGSYCGDADKAVNYGSNICESLNCVDSEGERRLHGESWCGYDVENYDFEFKDTNLPKMGELFQEALRNVETEKPVGLNFLGGMGGPVGSKFYRSVCMHGEVVVEPCADFRQEECLENTQGGFSEAACRVNRWQDCTAQYNVGDCENSDRRDCQWIDGVEYTIMAGLAEGTTLDKNSLSSLKGDLGAFETGERELGACVPKIPPGLNFWDAGETEEGETNSEAAGICGQANAVCPVTYEKGIVGGDWECVEHCECLPGGEAELKRAQLCMSLGDCGPKTNYIGAGGRGAGYKMFVEDLDDN